MIREKVCPKCNSEVFESYYTCFGCSAIMGCTDCVTKQKAKRAGACEDCKYEWREGLNHKHRWRNFRECHCGTRELV